MRYSANVNVVCLEIPGIEDEGKGPGQDLNV